MSTDIVGAVIYALIGVAVVILLAKHGQFRNRTDTDIETGVTALVAAAFWPLIAIMTALAVLGKLVDR